MVSCRFNDGETTKTQVSGEIGYFFLVGAQGILHGFQSGFVTKIFDLDNKEAEDIVGSQPGGMLVKLRNGIEFPNPSEDSHVKEKVYASIDTPVADVVVEGGGIIISVTERDIPVLGGMELSARFVTLESKAILAPSYVVDGLVRIVYVGKAVREIVGSASWVMKGRSLVLMGEVGEGELIIVLQFYAAAVIADQSGMELFSVISSSKPVFEQLARDVSVWKEISRWFYNLL